MIEIKIIGVGYNNYYQPYIEIYDKDNKLLFNDYSYNGIIKVCLNKNKVYKIIIKLNNKVLKTSLFIDKCRKKYILNFNSFFIRKVTFQLEDSNYKNLKIMKGEIILWQK